MAQRQRTRSPLLFFLAGAAYVFWSLARSAAGGGGIQSLFFLTGRTTPRGYPGRPGEWSRGPGRRQGPEQTQQELLDIREVWERLKVNFPQVADFLCPVTGKIMLNPVIAEDGYTYERADIVQWVKETGTSPMTKQPMGERLQDNGELGSAIDKLRRLGLDPSSVNTISWVKPTLSQSLKEQRSLDVCECLPFLQEPAQKVSKEEKALKRVYREMADVRDLLPEILDGQELPMVVMLGVESSGKSTLLEHFVGMPVLPRAVRFCTRMAIRLRLRTDLDSRAEMSVYGISGGREILEKPPRRIPMGNIAAFVQEEMNALVFEFGDKATNGEVLSNTIIDVEIRRPDVLNIDLMDLPGLTVVPGPKKGVVDNIVKRQLASNRRNGGNNLFVVVLSDVRANTNEAVGRILQEGLENQTLGVFSKADLAEDSSLLWSVVTGRDIDEGSAEELGHVPLRGGPWITTMLKSTKKPKGTPETSESLLEQLRREQVFFGEDEDLAHLQSMGVAGIPALRSALAKAYHKRLDGFWKPHIMRVLFWKLEEARFQTAMLGVGNPKAEFKRRLGPWAQESYRELMGRIVNDLGWRFTAAYRNTQTDGSTGAAQALGKVIQDVMSDALSGLKTHLREMFTSDWELMEFKGKKDLAFSLPGQFKQRCFLEEHPSEKDWRAWEALSDLGNFLNEPQFRATIQDASKLDLLGGLITKVEDTWLEAKFSDREQRALRESFAQQDWAQLLSLVKEISLQFAPRMQASHQQGSGQHSLTDKRRVIQAFEQGRFSQFSNYGDILEHILEDFGNTYRQRMAAFAEDVKQLRDSDCLPGCSWEDLDSEQPCEKFDVRLLTKHVEMLFFHRLPKLSDLKFPGNKQLYSARSDVRQKLKELNELEGNLLKVEESMCKAFDISQGQLESMRKEYQRQNP